MRLLLLKQKSRSTVIFLPSAKKPHQHAHSSTAFPFSVFRSALPPTAFSSQLFRDSAHFISIHFSRVLYIHFSIHFLRVLYISFFHTQSQNLASAHFPEFCIFPFHTSAFSGILHISFHTFFPGFVYHCFFRCRKCFLTPSASPLSAPCLPYPVFPLFFLPCLSASLLSDSFLPFLRQKHIR